MKINEMNENEEVYGNFLVADSKRCMDNRGVVYMVATLQDNSGTIESRKWNATPEEEAILAKGKVVYVKGFVNRYNNALQFRINEVDRVNEENIVWADLIASAPVPAKVLKAKLQAYLDSIQDKDVRMLVDELLKRFQKRFESWPAAVRNHHDYISGLLYHSITMADMACKAAEVYPTINRDVLLAGTIIHDIGKTVELSGAHATSFTLEGKLLGHISIGQAELRRAAKDLGMYAYDELSEEERVETHPLYHKKEIAVILEHMILSHHGQPDFGSPVRPLTREALVLSIIDDLDAKMMILDKAYAGVALGASTAKLFNMDERYFYKPYYTNDNVAPSGTSLEETLEDLK